ncbi:hypothetical protein, variant [Aphanomyces astaci]|uniref:BEACH domain-containing protein n=1 Tax=Aphanomyces astaci TaxID=112090 RepID=W4GT99_APHAT|nr:hypothetical protein, variant [Aphanomyces astaci]ETV82224.1 hypothetical protein, variant [Aphanomyces astaci]|eukprot:XP_009827893.1 hypothetical protein, variant [Aphanomyces astaci]
MKKQLTKLFSRKKTGSDEHDLTLTSSPPSKSPATATATVTTPVSPPPPPPAARYSRMTVQMKDIAAACKLFVSSIKKDSSSGSSSSSSDDIAKLVSSINALASKIQSNMGDASTRWVELYCIGDLGVPLSDQSTLPALVVETLDRIRLLYIVAHIQSMLPSPSINLPDDMALLHAVETLGTCLVGMLSNESILDRYRCEVPNVMRLAVEVYAPRTMCICDVVGTAINAIAASPAFNAGLVWYLHDVQAISVVVQTMQQLVTATPATPATAAAAMSWFQALQASSSLTCMPSPSSGGKNAADDVQLAVSKALGLHKPTFIPPPAAATLKKFNHSASETDGETTWPSPNEVRPATDLASTAPSSLSYSLLSHDPSVGHKWLIMMLQTSCRYSFVLVSDFDVAGGYNVVWDSLIGRVSSFNDVTDDSSSPERTWFCTELDFFKALLPLGEGGVKPASQLSMDWTFDACGAWNDAAVISLRNFIAEHATDPTKMSILTPCFKLVEHIICSRDDQIHRVEAATQLVASLVTKFPALASQTHQDLVLACVQHMAVHGPTLEVTRGILSSLCGIFVDAQGGDDVAMATKVCRSFTSMLHQVPSSDHPLRDTLLDLGLLDRGVYVAFQHVLAAKAAENNPEHTIRVGDDMQQQCRYVQALSALTCVVLHNHVAACTQFRQCHIHVALYGVISAWVGDTATFHSLFKILVELAGVTKSPLLVQCIEDDVRMILELMERCGAAQGDLQALGTLLSLLSHYLRNNVTVQRLWRDTTSGMEGLLSTLSALHASDISLLKSWFAIVSLLLDDAPDTRQYAVHHRMYHRIADTVVMAGWLTSSHAAQVLACLMELVFRPVQGVDPSNDVVLHNADAGVVSFLLYPHLDQAQQMDLLARWMSNLTKLSKPHGDTAKLVAAGVFTWLLPLVVTASEPFLPLLAMLATTDIPMPHLREYLHVLHATPGRGLPILDALCNANAVSHTHLTNHSYIHVTSCDKVWPPTSGYSFACWFQFPDNVKGRITRHTVTVPMCEGPVTFDHGLGATYGVLVGSTLSLYKSKADAVSGATEVAVLEVSEYAADIANEEEGEEGHGSFRICSNDDWFKVEVDDEAVMWKNALQVYAKPYVMLVSMYFGLDQQQQQSQQCFTRIYFEPATTCLRVETAHKHILFKNVDVGLFAQDASWHHLVLTHKRAVMGSSVVTLYIDGAEAGAKKLSYPASPPIGTPLRCYLGSDPHLFASTSIRPICLGPTWLMSDVLPPLAATCMFTLGPNYKQSFPGNTTSLGAIYEWTESALTVFLHWITYRKVELGRAANRLNLASLGMATQRNDCDMLASWNDGDMSAIRRFRHFLDRHCSCEALGVEWLALVASFKWADTAVMWSLHTDVPNSLTHVQYVDTEPIVPLHLAKLVPSLGGLRSLLLPLLDPSTTDLPRFLSVLTSCLQTNAATLALFLQAKGYSWLTAFLVEHMVAMDLPTLTAVAKLAIAGTLSTDKHVFTRDTGAMIFPVIVDTHAVADVLLNVAFRNGLSSPLQHHLVTFVAMIVHPSNPNAVFNARQLRQCQFVQWSLHFIGHLCRGVVQTTTTMTLSPTDASLVDEVVHLLAMYLQVEVHVDDMLECVDVLLSSLSHMDTSHHGRLLRRTLLRFLLHHVQMSPVIARTLVDSVFYRLQQDKTKTVVSPTHTGSMGTSTTSTTSLTSPQWCTPSTFSVDGLEHVLLEIICRSNVESNTSPLSSDAELASRLLFSLAQLQPAFAMHVLVNSQLHIRLKQVLSLHSGHVTTYIPLLAFVGLIPLSNVHDSPHHDENETEDEEGALNRYFPDKYTPTAMDRDCIDAVWDILGHLWTRNHHPSDTAATIQVFAWLNHRLQTDTLFFQAVCRSSCAFLSVVLRCGQILYPAHDSCQVQPPDAPSVDVSSCLRTFLLRSLLERDDWADNALFCLHTWPPHAPALEWLILVQTIVITDAKILTGNATVVAMKNVCSLLLGLLRRLVCRRQTKHVKRVDKHVKTMTWHVELTPTLVAFVCRVLEGCGDKAMSSVLGDEPTQHFYNVLVFCGQSLALLALYPIQHLSSWHLDVLRVVVPSKHLFLQQTNVSNVMLYHSPTVTSSSSSSSSAADTPFRVHMRQLSLHGTAAPLKEFELGHESDKLFVQCLATALFRILVVDPGCFEVTLLWQYLLQQRVGLVKDLLIVDIKQPPPPPSSLRMSSSAKKESAAARLDVFHRGFDQVLGIDSVQHAQYPVFYAWIQAQAEVLEDLFASRTDAMYAHLVDTLEGTVALRHPKHSDWCVRVAPTADVPPSCAHPNHDECKEEVTVTVAADKAGLRLAQYVSSQRDDMKEANAIWDRDQVATKYARSLWPQPEDMQINTGQSVYQLSWPSTALDAAEGPGRKRVRLQWHERAASAVGLEDHQHTSALSSTSAVPSAKKPPSFRVSSDVQRCLEFHDIVEVYRQCHFKPDALAVALPCKFAQTRELLRGVRTPWAVADTICSVYLQEGQYQLLGISGIVVLEVKAALDLAAKQSTIYMDQAQRNVVGSGEDGGSIDSSKNEAQGMALANTLFDVADLEAMQKRALIQSNASKLPDQEDGRDSDEDMSDDEDDSSHRESLVDLRTSDMEPLCDTVQPTSDVRQFSGALLRLLHRNDQTPHHACNAMSVAGMQKTSGVWLMCGESLTFVEGYVAIDDQQQPAKGLVDLRSGSDKPGGVILKPNPANISSPLVWRLKYHDIKQFYRIKFQLRPVGLELVDRGGWTYFCTFESCRCREDVFKALFQMPIHNSIYWAHVTPFRSTKRLRQSLTKKWLRGALSNFEYLIELNALAGRTFNDVTQYPVFPWVLADYTSETLDLTKDSTYRDLSKPMGGLGAKRADQFKDRYAAMSSDGFDGSPAFHYGTHYSCSAYVTYYLLRLEPFASMAQELQGGEFDKADRLFRSIGASWTSASSENLQDVRELIPEFYFLPEFLVNANHFDLGTTQNGEVVQDVHLPPWAANDPREFIRLHRRALESTYVSENLHSWIDLVFGYKQRGQEAVDALNVFMHMTYEGTIDIDTIQDPLLREATMAQIENFGQTPSKLFNSPHPARKVPQLQVHSSLSTLLTHAQDLSMNAQSSIEAYVKWHTPLAPPLVSIGKEYVYLKKAHAVQVLDEPVGDVQATTDNKYVCRGGAGVLVPPRFKKAIDWGTGSVALRSVKPKAALLVCVESCHLSAVTCGAVSADGLTFVSGGDDAVVNILECTKVHGERVLTHKGKLTGHEDAVTCVAIDAAFNVILSGSKDGSAIVWDLRMRRYLRDLRGHDAPLRQVGVNAANGNLVTITTSQLRLWSINGDLLAAAVLPSLGLAPVTAALCTTCDVWQNGVVLVTGHANGTIACWGVKYPTDAKDVRGGGTTTSSFVVSKPSERGGMAKKVDAVVPSCQLVVMKLLVEHRASVTALALTVDQRQVISGDADGWCMRWVDDSMTNGAT